MSVKIKSNLFKNKCLDPIEQAFREVFEYLIEDFKTYRPLLSAIKNEYEMMIIHQRDKIRELEPLKVMTFGKFLLN